MKLNRRAIFGGITAGTLAFGLAACGGGDDSDTGADGDMVSGEINGSGASFPDAYYAAAIEAYAEVNPDLIVTYNAVGSGTGKSEFGEGLNDFAGTDSLVGDDDGVEAGSFQYIPTVAAPITVSYNLPGVEGLQLDQDTLANIFQGAITTWNDPAIAATNEGVTLPDTAITIAHRSDGSGTTANFTKFLDEATDVWTLGSGDEVTWPEGSIGGEKNTGVAQVITQTEGAIGYVDLADATETGLMTASIENAEGAFIQPTLEATTAALDGAEVNEDLSYNPLNAAGAETYPIVAPTYILLHTEYEDETVAAGVKEFVNYLITDGQDIATDNYFAPLPDSLREQAVTALNDTIA
ncbi:phosphate ABC transporter substrate-binding protein PstS [Glycomyces sp. TRM65418]|uniref:phosphate ABC transporter substrate-binding protein PstS n=1 Tax=Glycomyces sp. TRM65418 TaxID=2867006 RepID=UPI001CE4EB0F|nr:phosphate ABC transporter substrate-binding protein PstS [Glycomyces sp. TRM65418]MCC3765566.1 phosphate ABC transporter substrate-binding protein PstS [Glycomyces sp. TRM65418]QZD57951.1 phosphate ABC transporter substrate-binding protein PstS [Glycomyces sp. TRM65418]